VSAYKSHPVNALSAIKAKKLATPGRHADGNGLYLVVDQSGAKRWLLRTVVHGRRRDIGLGSFRLVTLAEARTRALELRAIARNGGDPLLERRKKQKRIPTFEEAARRVHSERLPGWKNAKHGEQWINTLEDYVFPVIGDLRLHEIATPDILQVLGPIWLSKSETARRVKQRIAVVFDWAKAGGYVSGENPVAGVQKGLPKQDGTKSHHSAMPIDELSKFIRELHSGPEDRTSVFALEFLILTASRTKEVIGAKWEEIDLQRGIWTIPAERMKAGIQHRIPLSARCKEILFSMQSSFPSSQFVFPGARAEKPISNMALLMVMRRMGRQETVHGFRSTFRDWAAERTNFPNEVCEMALAHTIKNKAEAAYRRGDLLEKRQALMDEWSKYLEQ